jgi:hypothetical protein
MSWSGQIYGRGLPRPVIEAKPRIYQGTWGLSPYQSLYRPAPNHILSIALTPEWLLLASATLGISLLGFEVPTFSWSLLLFVLMITVSVIQALRGAMESRYLLRARDLAFRATARCFGLIFFFHLLQPAARLWGRVKHGLTPWRRRPSSVSSRPAAVVTMWSEAWRSADEWLIDVENELEKVGAIAGRGGDYDNWDLLIRGGLFASARLSMAVEGHAGRKQNLHFRTSFCPTHLLAGLALGAIAAGVSSALSASWVGLGIVLAFAAALVRQTRFDWKLARNQVGAALEVMKGRGPFFFSETAESEWLESDPVPAADAAE